MEQQVNFRERFGEWGVVLGASEGLGQGLAERIAKYGMDVVLVGHHPEDLTKVSEDIATKYDVKTMVVCADFSENDALEPVFAKTQGLDVGFMSYVACLHKFGKVQDTPWEDHKKMLNVNINSFLAAFHHYLGIFARQDRGLIINISSLAGIASSPYNGQYGAGKSYIKKMTEASAFEMRNTGVMVRCVTLGSTRTPSFLSNLPGGPLGERAIQHAMTIEDTLDGVFSDIWNSRSFVVGERPRAAAHRYEVEYTYDQAAEEMGAYYER